MIQQTGEISVVTRLRQENRHLLQQLEVLQYCREKDQKKINDLSRRCKDLLDSKGMQDALIAKIRQENSILKSHLNP